MLGDVKFTLDFTRSSEIDYWVNPNPGTGEGLFLALALMISIWMLIVGVGVWYLLKKRFKNSPPKRSLLTKIMWTLYSFSAVGFLITFFRSQGLRWVSLRLLWLLFGLSFLVLAVFFIYYYLTKIPGQINKIESEIL